MNIAKADGTIELNQSRYAREIYNTYRDQEVVVKVASTPMKDNVKLSKANADPEYMNVFSIGLAVLTRLENRRNRAHVLTIFGSCQNILAFLLAVLVHEDRCKNS